MDDVTQHHLRSRTRKSFRLALGIERFGLISLRFPIVVAIIFAALAVAAAFGVMRIKIDDSLSQLFRSNTPEFRQYEEVTQAVPVERIRRAGGGRGQDAAARDNSIEKLRDLVTDLQLVDGTRGAHFAVLGAPAAGARQAAGSRCSRTTCRRAPTMTSSSRTSMSNEIIRGKLLSEDGTLALIVLVARSRRRRAATSSARRSAISARLMAEDLAGTGLNGELSGVPVMQLEIRNAVERDRADL